MEIRRIAVINKKEYIQQLKQLIKKYHPDLCKDEYLEKIYNEITVKLNNKLNQIKSINEENAQKLNIGKTKILENNSLINISNQDYQYYKLGIKYYRNIHPNNFYKNNKDRTIESKKYEEKLKILNKIFISFNCSEYYFTKVITDYPKSEWVNDSKEKINLLKKLYKNYQNMNIENNTLIIDGNKFAQNMGLRLM